MPKYKVGDKFIFYYGENKEYHVVYKILCVSPHKHWCPKEYHYFVESTYSDDSKHGQYGYDMKREEAIDCFLKYDGKYPLG